jgi:hypothetical protein
MIPSLCEFCTHMKEVVSGKGSRFLLCDRSTTDHRFPKYPPQPVVKCAGFERSSEEDHDSL